jgi:hypothetical protein
VRQNYRATKASCNSTVVRHSHTLAINAAGVIGQTFEVYPMKPVGGTILPFGESPGRNATATGAICAWHFRGAANGWHRRTAQSRVGD